METFTVNLEGGSPWGFSIQGGVDHRSPLRVGKVTPGGRASKAGLVAGDYILFVNGEDSKKLKHLQAQQIIKKSTLTVTLICTKVRPGVTSPAVSSTSSFSYPGAGERGGVTTPQRVPVTKAQPISRPKPPQAPPHARSASTGTSSECTPPGSSSPQSNVDVYDVKFQGMDAVCIDHSHPQENGDSGTDKCPPGMDLTCIDRSHPLQNGICTNQNLSDHPATGNNANTVAQRSGYGKVDKREQVDAPPAVQFNRLTKDALATAINQAAAARVRRESNGEREEPSTSGSSSGVSSSHVPVREEAVVQSEQAEQPLMYQLDVPGNTVQVTEAASQEEQSDPPLMYQLDNVSTVDKDNSASQPEETQHGPNDVFVDGGAPVVEERVDQVEQVEKPPLMYTFNTQTAAPEHTTANKVTAPPKEVAAPCKEEEPVAIVRKDPGWYKQMFQQFQNTVEEQLPGATSGSTTKSSTDDDSAYVYDYRGLKVRKNSLSRVQPKEQEEEQRAKKNQTPDEEPVYVYDYRGLRVRADSTSKVQDSTTATLTTPQSHVTKPRPKSASAAMNNSSTGSEVTKDDVLSLSKQPTTYKTQQYNTGASRQYWKEKDKDHQEWDEKLRQSQEQPPQEHHQHSYSGSEDYTANLTHMHPLLRQAAEESGSSSNTTTQQVVPNDDQPELFERIEATKLQEAVSNASAMGQLQNLGVPSHLIPAVIDAQKEAAAAEAAEAAAAKKEKPPPGPMAKALFDFTAQSSKELSFQKGDFFQLVHTVDDNWLEAKIDGNEGIIPRNYVKVLTMQQYEEILQPEPPKPTQLAKALFDFQGQSDREISFEKGDELYIEKQVDANWYEGFSGEVRGIFPVAYVQVIEGSH